MASKPITPPVDYYHPSPSTERAKAARISADKSLQLVAFPSKRSVIVRDLTDPGKLVALFKRHNAQVNVARVSPCGAYVCSGDASGKVFIWIMKKDAPLECRVTFEAQQLAGPILDIAWDGETQRLIVSGEGRDSLAVAFHRDGNSVGQITGHTMPITTCDFRKSRPYRLVTGSADQSLAFFEGPPFKFKSSVPGEHKNAVQCARFSPDDSLIASVSGGKNVVMMDGKTGDKAHTFPTTHTGTILGCAWSPDSSQLATVSADKSMRVWNAQDGAAGPVVEFGKKISHQQVGVARVVNGWITVSFNTDITPVSDNGQKGKPIIGHQRVAGVAPLAGGALLSCGGDGRVFSWNKPGDGTSLVEDEALGADVFVNQFVLAADQTMGLINTTSGLWMFDRASGNVKKVEGVVVDAVAFLGASKDFVTLTKKTKALQVHGADGSKKGKGGTVAFETLCLAASPDGCAVAVGGGKGSAGDAAVFSVAAGSGDLTLQTALEKGQHLSPVLSVAFNSQSTHLATGDGTTRCLFVWETRDLTSKVAGPLEHSKSAIVSLAFHATQPGMVLVGGQDGDMVIYNVMSNPVARTAVEGSTFHAEGLHQVAWEGADGANFISAANDGSICRWKCI